MWELFFEVRVIGGGKRCRQLGEVTVAQLVNYGEGGGEGDKLLLREGVLGIQVHIEVTHAQLNGLDATKGG